MNLFYNMLQALIYEFCGWKIVELHLPLWAVFLEFLTAYTDTWCKFTQSPSYLCGKILSTCNLYACTRQDTKVQKSTLHQFLVFWSSDSTEVLFSAWNSCILCCSWNIAEEGNSRNGDTLKSSGNYIVVLITSSGMYVLYFFRIDPFKTTGLQNRGRWGQTRTRSLL